MAVLRVSSTRGREEAWRETEKGERRETEKKSQEAIDATLESFFCFFLSLSRSLFSRLHSLSSVPSDSLLAAPLAQLSLFLSRSDCSKHHGLTADCRFARRGSPLDLGAGCRCSQSNEASAAAARQRAPPPPLFQHRRFGFQQQRHEERHAPRLRSGQRALRAQRHQGPGIRAERGN